jgi:hypothetical protein
MQGSVSTGEKPQVSKARRYLRPDEANQLIAAAAKRGRHGFRDKTLLRLVYRHGLRAAEACCLRWSQIDLDNRTIHVARVKNSKDSLHTLDRDEVRDLRTLRKDSDNPYVFVTERGGPLSTDTLAYIVREAGLEAGLDVDAHPHMLRHAAGYFLANEGLDTRLIQEFLGHRDIRHTVRYTELSPRRLAAVRVRKRNPQLATVQTVAADPPQDRPPTDPRPYARPEPWRDCPQEGFGDRPGHPVAADLWGDGVGRFGWSWAAGLGGYDGADATSHLSEMIVVSTLVAQDVATTGGRPASNVRPRSCLGLKVRNGWLD